MLKDAVSDAALQQAVAVRTAIAQGTKILGPSLGGALVTLFGALAPFYVDAASFGIAAGLTLLLHAGGGSAQEAAHPANGEPFLRAAAAGLRKIAKSPPLRRLAGLYAAILLGVNLVDSQFIVLLRGQAHAAAILGLSMTASGAGMAAAAAFFLRRRHEGGGYATPFGVIAMGADVTAEALLVAARTPGFVPGAAIVLGAGAALAFIPLQAALQRKVPSEWTGRVIGSVRSLGGLAVVGGPLLGGALSEGLGAVREFLLAGGLLLALGALALVLRYGREGEVPRAEGFQ